MIKEEKSLVRQLQERLRKVTDFQFCNRGKQLDVKGISDIAPNDSETWMKITGDYNRAFRACVQLTISVNDNDQSSQLYTITGKVRVENDNIVSIDPRIESEKR